MYTVAVIYMTVFYLMPIQLQFWLHDLKVPPTLVGLADHLLLLISGLLLGDVGGGLVLQLVASRLGTLTPPAVRGWVMSGLTNAIFLG